MPNLMKDVAIAFTDYVNSSRRQRVAERLARKELKYRIGNMVQIVTHIRSNAIFVNLKGRVARIVDVFPSIDTPYRLQHLDGKLINFLFHEQELQPTVNALDDVLIKRGATIINEDAKYIEPPKLPVITDTSVKDFLKEAKGEAFSQKGSKAPTNEVTVIKGYVPPSKIDYLELIATGVEKV